MDRSPETRPDPEALLERVREADQLARRARLKIFIGAAPGVGKTFAMLQEAQEQRRAGVDVVVGAIETHGRPETAALLEGLELLPPRTLEHRGVALRDFDLEAAIARRPGLLLLDELAHTNAPGLRHAKRWQDVRDLLAEGIHVATTLNVQHVESLNDVVEQLTGVRVRETVPDSILDRADEIELVDLPPDDLLQRLREGKVYVPEQARHAIDHFFRRGNLTALRELALRRTAERVGRQVETLRRTGAAEIPGEVRERIAVCVGDPHRDAPLIRAGRRLADALRADWWVVHVSNPGELRHGDAERRAVHDALGFAEDLGAETAVLTGHGVADEIAEFARAHGITRILLRRSSRPRWQTLLRGTLAEAVIRRVRGADLVLVDPAGAPRDGTGIPVRPGAAPPRPPTPPPYAWAAATVAVALCTGLGFLMQSRIDLSNLVMIYLLGVVLVAVWCGRGPAVLASVLSVAALNYCFVPPVFTFNVAHPQYLITLGALLFVAVALSTMATRLQDQAAFARAREERVAGLLRLGRELAASATPERVATAGGGIAGELLGGETLLLAPDPGGTLRPFAGLAEPIGFDERERSVAAWVHEHGEPAGRGTSTLPAGRWTFAPLLAARGPLGVLGVAASGGARTSPEWLRLLRACADLVALALERARLAQEAESARLAVEGERTRSALLASVSHDLRTPLAVIQGAVTSLAERAGARGAAAAADAELLATAAAESDRLNRLVGDLLDITRLESGVRLEKDWQSVEEMVGAAVARAFRGDESRPVEVHVPRDLPLVAVDGVLLTQALIHLLENARAHTPAGTPVVVRATLEGDEVGITVADRGPGLDAADLDRVFEKFYRGRRDRGAAGARPAAAAGPPAPTSAAGPPGSGLGLAICRAIVEAHGGRITAEQRPGGGALFLMRLPRGGEPPGAPEAPDEPGGHDAGVVPADPRTEEATP